MTRKTIKLVIFLLVAIGGVYSLLLIPNILFVKNIGDEVRKAAYEERYLRLVTSDEIIGKLQSIHNLTLLETKLEYLAHLTVIKAVRSLRTSDYAYAIENIRILKEEFPNNTSIPSFKIILGLYFGNTALVSESIKNLVRVNCCDEFTHITLGSILITKWSKLDTESKANLRIFFENGFNNEPSIYFLVRALKDTPYITDFIDLIPNGNQKKLLLRKVS